jgi:tetratricopeptide (TPR) repeat protein
MPVTRTFFAVGLFFLAGIPDGGAETGPVAPEIDLSALQYYASRHETTRVETEIRRLRSLYPGWQPPVDPAAIVLPGASEDQALWELFGADKLDELQAELARRKAADPSFVTPESLASKLALKEARRSLVAASAKSDFAGVVAIADKTPELTAPDDLEAAWLAAAAYAQTGAEAKALSIVSAILTDVQDPAARLATVRKAVAFLSPADVQTVLNMGKAGPGGRSEFAAVGPDLVRQHLGRILSGAAKDELSSVDVKSLEDAATASGADPDDAAMLGWRDSRKKDWAGASHWFEIALAALPDVEKATRADAKIAQGAALAMRENGRLPEAEALAYRWREKDPAVMLLYFSLVEPDLVRAKPTAIAPDRLERFSSAATQQQWGYGAQALGWYAYNVGQLTPARAWFEKAMAWQPRDAAALGLALTLRRLDDATALAAFLKANLATFPALANVAAMGAKGGYNGYGATVSGRMAADYRRKDFAGCVAIAARERAHGPDAAAAAEQKGWCLMALDRPQEAADAFVAAQSSAANRTNPAYGEALARLRAGEAEGAIRAALSAPQSGQRRKEIAQLALNVRATSAFDRDKYAATLDALEQRRTLAVEPRRLAMLHGWSLYHLGHRDEARQVFITQDEALSTAESRLGISLASAPLGR